MFFLAPRFIFSLAQSYGANPYFCARLPEPHVNSTTLNSCIIVNRFTKYSKCLAPAGILREPFYKIFQKFGPCGHIKGALLQNSQNSRRVGRVVSRRVASVVVSSFFTIFIFSICILCSKSCFRMFNL